MTLDHDPLDTTATEAARQRDAQLQQLEREREVSDFKWLMATVEGRRFVHRLLRKAGVHRSSFSLSEVEMAFREGNRNIGVFLMAEIDEVCPERYHQMVKERKADDRRQRTADR